MITDITGVTVLATLGVLGLVAGSFSGAMVWRLRAYQLREDKKAGDPPTDIESKQVSKIPAKSMMDDRSVCLHCGHTLAWYDLIPLLSWLSLKNRCRYCHKKIGLLEPTIEVGLATYFILSYLLWPVPLETLAAVLQFSLWLVAGVGLAVLLVYDAKWFLLPNPIMYSVIVVSAVYSFLTLSEAQFAPAKVIDVLLSVIILSGLYFLIYFASKRQWIGFGDVKLGLALALLLSDWQLALLSLFLANAIGTIIILPLLLSGKVKRHAHIPFGPLLIAGWFLAGLFGHEIISWYLQATMVGF